MSLPGAIGMVKQWWEQMATSRLPASPSRLSALFKARKKLSPPTTCTVLLGCVYILSAPLYSRFGASLYKSYILTVSTTPKSSECIGERAWSRGYLLACPVPQWNGLQETLLTFDKRLIPLCLQGKTYPKWAKWKPLRSSTELQQCHQQQEATWYLWRWRHPSEWHGHCHLHPHQDTPRTWWEF